MLVEIHLLQNHSPSNPNRDDLGAPKSAVFGGKLRARMSSQCLKNAIRGSETFAKALDGYLGKRTKYFPELVKEALASSKLFPDEKERAAIVAACERIADQSDKGGKSEEEEDSADSARQRTEQLIFLAPNEATAFVTALARLKDSMPTDYKRLLNRGKKKDDDKKGKGKEKAEEKESEDSKDASGRFYDELKKSLNGHAVDIALFGRMTTSNAFENVEASLQVAHALSTHEIQPEVDYFTAVDDMQSKGAVGAAHIGENQFVSATFYKYFSLDWNAFVKQLSGGVSDEKSVDLAKKALSAFIQASGCSVPSGKRNSFGNNNLPDAIVIEVKEKNVATNYANAFLKSAKPNEEQGWNLMEASLHALADYAGKLSTAYELDPSRALFAPTCPEGLKDGLFKTDAKGHGTKRVETLSELAAWTVEQVSRKGAGQ